MCTWMPRRSLHDRSSDVRGIAETPRGKGGRLVSWRLAVGPRPGGIRGRARLVSPLPRHPHGIRAACDETRRGSGGTYGGTVRRRRNLTTRHLERRLESTIATASSFGARVARGVVRIPAVTPTRSIRTQSRRGPAGRTPKEGTRTPQATTGGRTGRWSRERGGQRPRR